MVATKKTRKRTVRKTTTKKTTTKKTTTKKTASKAKKAAPKKKSARKAFGGYLISFDNRRESLQDVFGKKPMTPGDMNKKIWAFIKAKRLSNK